MRKPKWRVRIALALRLVVAALAFGALAGGTSACGDEDLTVPGQLPPTRPPATETPDDDDDDV